jgi:hypothetical protein
MSFEVFQGQANPANSLAVVAQQRMSQPFDHVGAYGHDRNDESACALYLRAGDLSDLRRLPI